jgi:hypothetical protein
VRHFLDRADHGPDGVTDLLGLFAIADELWDRLRSGVLRQAHNQLAVQMAVLYRLLGAGSARRH